MYSTDASFYQIKPLAVVLPLDESDVKKTVEIARIHKLRLLPRGGGTSLAGQTVGDGIVIDFSKYMNKILEFNEQERWVKVQPDLSGMISMKKWHNTDYTLLQIPRPLVVLTWAVWWVIILREQKVFCTEKPLITFSKLKFCCQMEQNS